VRLVAVIDLGHPETGRGYEDKVLELLKRHGGRLEQRLHGTDGRTEVHLLWFPSRAAYEALLADPARARYRAEWGSAVPTGRVIEIAEN
jgi:uncharacterized protein (DUF1330 family)